MYTVHSFEYLLYCYSSCHFYWTSILLPILLVLRHITFCSKVCLLWETAREVGLWGSRAPFTLQLYSHGDINVGEALMNTTCLQPPPLPSHPPSHSHMQTQTHTYFSLFLSTVSLFWLHEIRHGQLFRVFRSDIYTLTHGSVISIDEIPCSFFSFPDDYRSLYWDTSANNHSDEIAISQRSVTVN